MPLTLRLRSKVFSTPDRHRLASACLMIFALLAAACLLGGCSAQNGVEFTPLTGETAESQWELHLMDGDNDTQLTAAMAVSMANPDEARLYLMLPFGQTLGKCVLSGGKADCEASAPGVGPLLQKAAGPMARILAADAGAEDGGMFADEIAQPKKLRGRGWRCEAEDEWLIYREDKAKWTLRLKRTK